MSVGNVSSARTASSVVAFLGHVIALRPQEQPHPPAELYFRGESKTYDDTKPSLFRNKGHRQHETDMLYSIEADAATEFSQDLLTFDKLVKAQHYGLKTRLLDITTNPLIALYFACEVNETKTGLVHALGTAREEVKYFSSDTVSCKANLPG